MFDVCIIGSGPAGLAAAITAAKKGAKVKLLDKNKKAGKKLYATGNGKCNITNTFIDFKTHYHSDCKTYEAFLDDVMGQNPYASTTSFMDSIGIVTYANKEGYVYPISNQASSVVWALIDEVNKHSIECDFNAEVVAVSKQEELFEISTSNELIKAKQVIFACGGKSYASLGGTEFGYEIAQKLGHTIIKPRPCLCGLYTQEDLSAIAGVRARASATLRIDGDLIATEIGEIQFTEKGLSGIAIFNLSALAGKALQASSKVTICLDLGFKLEKAQILELYDNNSNRTILGALNGMFNDKLCSFILSKEKINGKNTLNTITKTEFIDLINQFSSLSFHISDLYNFEQAQICAGGVSVDEISSKSCESKLVKNAYFVGEMLDIDGVCGGYNITFAVLSGIRAGEHIHVAN